MEDNEHVFTFGFGQLHEGCYHVISAESTTEARDAMFRKFGDKWSMHYQPPMARDRAGVEKYNLTEVK